MAIDDPLEAFDQQYMREEPDLPNKLAKFFGETGAKLAFPHGGFVLDAMLKAAHVLFDRVSTEERLLQMWNLIRKELERRDERTKPVEEQTKANVDDVARAIQLATWYDNHERDDSKRERYVKLIGNAVRSEAKVEDITTFIQTIEQLNERDVIVLRVLNKVMNKVGDWKPATTTAGTATIHPTISYIVRRSFHLKSLSHSVRTQTPVLFPAKKATEYATVCRALGWHTR